MLDLQFGGENPLYLLLSEPMALLIVELVIAGADQIALGWVVSNKAILIILDQVTRIGRI